MPLLEEITRIVDDSSHRLFQTASPPIRYYILTDIRGKRKDDTIVQRTVKECATYLPRMKLLQTMNKDGTWPISKQRRKAEEAGPGAPYGWTYITVLRNLFRLSEYITTAEEGQIRNSLEWVLKWQTRDGYLPGPTAPGIALPHYNGFALRTLLTFGMERDARTQMLIRWLIKQQRPDGGWIIPYLEDVRYMPEYASLSQEKFLEKLRKGDLPRYDPSSYYDVPSCIWSTMMVVRGFCWSNELAARRETRLGADFFLNRFFKPNYHSLFYKSPDNWTKLRYPTYFGSGLLALDLLTWLGYGANDPRMDRPIRWLLQLRSKDGFWAHSERPNPERDQWITEIALSILNRYAESLRGEPFGMKAEALKESR